MDVDEHNSRNMHMYLCLAQRIAADLERVFPAVRLTGEDYKYVKGPADLLRVMADAIEDGTSK